MFKRFNDNDNIFSNSSKIENLISFPIHNLDMSEYVNGYNSSSYIYDLFGVANHEGSGDWGHYWANVKNSDNNWYKFNDHIVSTCQEKDIVSAEAYCLFYIRRD